MLRSLGLFAVLPLAAQVFPLERTRSTFWDRGLLVSYDPSDHSVVFPAPKQPGGSRKVTLDESKVLVDFAQGVYWSNNKLHSTNPKNKPIKGIYSSRDGSEWTLEGWIQLTEDIDVDSIHALGGDRFLLIAFQRIQLKGKSSLFALATRNEQKELVLDRVLEMGLSKPWGVPRAKTGFAAYFGVNDAYLHLFISSTFVMRTESALAMVHGRPGYVWLMDLGKENLSMDLIKIHDGVKEGMLADGYPLEHCVLGGHPMPDGRFLLATRSEKAVLFGAKNHPRPKQATDIKDPLFKGDLAVQRQLSIMDFPDLLWWELDPTEKTLRSVPSPAGIPERLTKAEEVKTFRFWFTPSGAVGSTLSLY